jgi:hypothetical protein
MGLYFALSARRHTLDATTFRMLIALADERDGVLASRIGISRSYLWLLKSGSRPIPPWICKRLLEVLGDQYVEEHKVSVSA